MMGRIHSVESCGTVDGPGIRYVIFMQGCPLRCQYCHNPDTRDPKGGTEISADEVLQEIEGYVPYMQFSGGGITVSGGEPLLQAEFVTELFRRCKQIGIHTALDTSGICFEADANKRARFNELLDVTDLVLLDLKQIDDQKHRTLIGSSNQGILAFAHYLSERQIPVWIRHVLVPGYTDAVEDLQRLARFLTTLANVQKIELLPYHQLGVYKWRALGLEYPLEHVKPPTEEQVAQARDILEGYLNEDLYRSSPS